jgi:DnaJ domain
MNKEKLLSQFDILRTEYIKLINDKDVLLNWGKPQLEALYNTRIGIFQVELLQLQLRITAFKKKVQMVRSIIVQNLPLDVQAIELLVASELANAELKIMQQLFDIEKSKNLLTNLDSPTRSADLRKLYRELAKQLHPDINENSSPEQEHLWHMVNDAYKHGDVEKLKALQVAYEKELLQGEKKLEELTEEQISLKSETLKQGIKIFNVEIEKIKNEFPFTIEQQIKDDDWVNEEVKKITTEITQLRAYEGELIIEFSALINNYGGAKPELN